MVSDFVTKVAESEFYDQHDEEKALVNRDHLPGDKALIGVEQTVEHGNPDKQQQHRRKQAQVAAQLRELFIRIAWCDQSREPRREKLHQKHDARGDDRQSLPDVEGETLRSVLSLLRCVEIYGDKRGEDCLHQQILKVADEVLRKADEIGLKRRAEGRGCHKLLDEAEQLADEQETCDGKGCADDMVILY